MAKYLVIVRREKTQEAVIEVEASGRIKASQLAIKRADSDDGINWEDTNAVDGAYEIDVTKENAK